MAWFQVWEAMEYEIHFISILICLYSQQLFYIFRLFFLILEQFINIYFLVIISSKSIIIAFVVIFIRFVFISKIRSQNLIMILK
jgi:hypothetical protein